MSYSPGKYACNGALVPESNFLNLVNKWLFTGYHLKYQQDTFPVKIQH